MDKLIDDVYRVHDSDGDVIAYMTENGIPMTPELFAGVLKKAREAREAVELRLKRAREALEAAELRLLRKLEELRGVLFERRQNGLRRTA
jgi:hypothetical protein